MPDAPAAPAPAAPAARGGVFRSLRHRNARLFFLGLLVSNVGSWLQLTGVSYLLYDLTGNAADLGFNVAFQFLPMLLLGTWCGAIADRHDRLRITLVTQSLLALQALTLGAIVIADLVTVPAVYALSFAVGVIGAFDNPARRGFVTELVPTADVPNAMALNTTVMTGSRMVGAAITAALVGSIGPGWLFVVNGVSFTAMLGGLLTIHRPGLHRAPARPSGGSPVREVFGFVRHNPRLLTMFTAYVLVSTFAFNYGVALPKLADLRWDAPWAFGWVLTVTGFGSILGSLSTARHHVVPMRWFIGNIGGLGVASIALAFAPSVATGLVVAVAVGFCGSAMIASGNAITQQESPPDMRGRLLALTAVAFLGSTPIGGPITGLVADFVSVEWSVAYGGVVALASALAAVWMWK